MNRFLKVCSVIVLALFMVSAIAFAATCPKCGYDNPDDYKFCVKCGTKLSKSPNECTSCKNLAGPKKTIAVVGFENASGIAGFVNLGDDFTTQLTDALMQTEKFTILSRTELDKVFIEQDLAASGRMAKSMSTSKGKAIPAQILVTGKITEFQEDSDGGNQGLTIHGVSLGGSKSNAHIGVIIQIIDSTTGEVLDSRRVEGKATSSGFSIGYSGSFNIGTSSFKSTPLGKATQIAIDKAVIYISDKIAAFPWKGRVVTVKGNLVYINAGADAGIVTGSTFAVYRQGESLVDPETGIDLGSERTKIGDISVVEVQPKYSKATVSNSSQEIVTADLVLEY